MIEKVKPGVSIKVEVFVSWCLKFGGLTCELYSRDVGIIGRNAGSITQVYVGSFNITKHNSKVSTSHSNGSPTFYRTWKCMGRSHCQLYIETLSKDTCALTKRKV